jgi:hypothetical protein
VQVALRHFLLLTFLVYNIVSITVQIDLSKQFQVFAAATVGGLLLFVTGGVVGTGWLLEF